MTSPIRELGTPGLNDSVMLIFKKKYFLVSNTIILKRQKTNKKVKVKTGLD
jgi:hypothetical protein